MYELFVFKMQLMSRNKFDETKSILNKEVLKYLLNEKQMTYKDIGIHFNINQRTVSKIAKEYNIPKNYKNIAINANKFHKLDVSIDDLVDLYCNKKCSLRAIAKIYNCTHSSVSKKLKENNIEIRPFDYIGYYECRRKYKLYRDKDISRVYRVIMGNIKGRRLKTYEHVHHIDFDRKNNNPNNLFLFDSGEIHLLYHGFVRKNGLITPDLFLKYYEDNLKNTYDNYEWLYDEYIINSRSCNDISKEIGVSRESMVKKLKNLGIYDLRKPTVNQYD